MMHRCAQTSVQDSSLQSRPLYGFFTILIYVLFLPSAESTSHPTHVNLHRECMVWESQVTTVFVPRRFGATFFNQLQLAPKKKRGSQRRQKIIIQGMVWHILTYLKCSMTILGMVNYQQMYSQVRTYVTYVAVYTHGSHGYRGSHLVKNKKGKMFIFAIKTIKTMVIDCQPFHWRSGLLKTAVLHTGSSLPTPNDAEQCPQQRVLNRLH